MTHADSGQTREQLPPAELPEPSSLVSHLPGQVAPDSDSVIQRPGTDAERNDLAPFVHQYVRDYINFADQKAAFVFAAATALIVYAEKEGAVTSFKQFASGFAVKNVAAATTLVLLFLAALAAVAVIRPRLKGKLRGGVIYWDEIRTTDMRGYISRAASLSPGAAQTEILSHSYVLAGIAQQKYRWLAKSLWLGIAGFGALLVFLFLKP